MLKAKTLMKTPKEWLEEIKQASDSESRHGSSVILLESDIKAILFDGWKEGMQDAEKLAKIALKQL